jgi:hypothetical protein
MSNKENLAGEQAGGEVRDPVMELQDPVLRETLENFRLSVHAWSESEFNRPRTVPATFPSHKTWRLAAAWALGCVLVAGGVSGGVYERHHRQELARVAAARQVEQQRLLAEEQARETDDLLAKVDSDVSREVPSAMEPLTQLMAEDESQ